MGIESRGTSPFQSGRRRGLETVRIENPKNRRSREAPPPKVVPVVPSGSKVSSKLFYQENGRRPVLPSRPLRFLSPAERTAYEQARRKFELRRDAAIGRKMHAQQEYPPGYVKEHPVPNPERPNARPQRADALNLRTRHDIELKPARRSAIEKGIKQVIERNRRMSIIRGGTWSGTVETYELHRRQIRTTGYH